MPVRVPAKTLTTACEVRRADVVRTLAPPIHLRSRLVQNRRSVTTDFELAPEILIFSVVEIRVATHC
jgi:hypothetical protein